LYSALGHDDPVLAATREQMQRQGQLAEMTGSILGKQQGILLRAILEKTGRRRVCVAGGDTSGQVAQQLDIFALEILIPIAPGAPLCRASSRLSQFNGLQISFKGGQNGGADYFGAVLQGHT
jgi:uncharacterized protein YgbK (DUF1537 family)